MGERGEGFGGGGRLKSGSGSHFGKCEPDPVYRLIHDVRDKLVELGFDPIGGSPAEFAALIASEMDKWGKVIRAAGVKLD